MHIGTDKEEKEEPTITKTEHLRIVQLYIQRCKVLEKENEQLREKISKFYGI